MKPNKIPKNVEDPKTRAAVLRNIDYISQIPRGVLHHILYFLPFEYWIILTMVSRQWKNLLHETPILILNEEAIVFKMTKRQIRTILNQEDSRIDGPDQPTESSIEDNKRRYREFVETTLLGHSGSPIDIMKLNFHYKPKNHNKSMVDNWVQFMMTRDIQELELNFNTIPVFHNQLSSIEMDPFYILPCKSFEPKFKCLRLISCKFKASCFGVFANLRKLYLSNAQVFDSSIGELLSKCPVLEDLHMKKCFVSEIFFICGKDLKIKYLKLCNCATEDWNMYQLDISAPNLLVFKIKGLFLRSSTIRNATNLVECSINIKQMFSDNKQGDLLARLLIGLKHCKILTLNSWCIQILATTNSLLFNQLRSSFINLVQMKLTIGYTKQELAGMVVLLQICPFLKSLILEFDKLSDIHWFQTIDGIHAFDVPEVFTFIEDNYLESRIEKIHFLQYCLKDIEIRGFLEENEKMHLLKYLIKNALVLENLVIYLNGPKGGCRQWTPQHLEFLHGLLKVPRLSLDVNVSIQKDYVHLEN